VEGWESEDVECVEVGVVGAVEAGPAVVEKATRELLDVLDSMVRGSGELHFICDVSARVGLSTCGAGVDSRGGNIAGSLLPVPGLGIRIVDGYVIHLSLYRRIVLVFEWTSRCSA
jgi:hypothetical protein